MFLRRERQRTLCRLFPTPPNAVTPVLAYAAAGGTIQQVGDGTLDGAFYGINSAGTGVGMLGGSASARQSHDSYALQLPRPGICGHLERVKLRRPRRPYSHRWLPVTLQQTPRAPSAMAASRSAGRNSHAVIYTQSGGNWTTTNLNTTSLVTNLDGWSLTSAEDISHNGDYIVGYGPYQVLSTRSCWLQLPSPRRCCWRLRGWPACWPTPGGSGSSGGRRGDNTAPAARPTDDSRRRSAL